MKIFVINLDRDKEKLAFVQRQMDALGLAFDRVPAVDGRGLSEEARRKAVNGFAWWCAMGRPIQPAEIGCALSHYGIYERITEPVCILEDDVELRPGFPEVLERVARFIDPTKPQVVMLSDNWGCRAAKGRAEGIVASSDAWCTDGYVITPLAAQVIRKANLPIEAPCDTWRRWVRRGLIELYHAFPTTVIQRQDLFGSSTDPCFARAKRSRSLPARILHKCVRLFGRTVDELRWRLVKWPRKRPRGVWAWSLVAVMVGIAFFMNWTFPLTWDDCFYATWKHEGAWERVGTIGRAFLIEVRDPHRPFVHFITRIFCGCFDKSVFNVFNSLMVGVLLVMINRVARKTWALRADAAAIAAAMSFFVLFKGESYLWICGSLNYLWTGVMTLGFLIVRERLEADRLSAGCTLAFLPVAALIGEANESFSPPICIALAVFGLLDLRRLNWKKLAVYVAYAAAAAALCWHEKGRAESSPAWTLAGFVIAVAKVALSVKCVWVAALVVALSPDRRRVVRDNLFEITAICASVVANVAIGFVGERVLWVANLLAVVLVVRVWKPPRFVSAAAFLTVIAVFCLLIAPGLDIRRNFREFVAQYEKTPNAPLCHDYVQTGVLTRFFFQTFYQWQDFGFHPNAFANYYSGGRHKAPLALTRPLYDGLVRSRSYCRPARRLKTGMEAYADPDWNTIVIPIVRDGPLDRPFNEVEVVYEYPQGIVAKVRRAWNQQGCPAVAYREIPVRLTTPQGDYWLVGKDPRSDAFIRDIRLKQSDAPHPDTGEWWL